MKRKDTKNRNNQVNVFLKRIKREKITMDKMIRIYCKHIHNCGNPPCADCNEIKEYAFKRLLNCPYEEDKPVCSNCTVHCYKPDMREKVRKIMRFSGPRILFRHPYLAIMHLLDEKLKRIKKVLVKIIGE